ncbi:MAG: hypothetical protein Ta2B_10590 [Termitinemataceae bacterium]|nr:MAG: hypothetical protein Ta2B_10590 [Termitinemataceae bacterium]
MSKLNVNVRYSRVCDPPEKNSGELLTEQSGYIPAKIQIENMIYAGRRLDEARKEQYDFGANFEGDEFDYPDPTRTANFDLVDASRIASETEKRLKDTKTAQEAAKAKIEAEKQAENDELIKEAKEARSKKSTEKIDVSDD